MTQVANEQMMLRDHRLMQGKTLIQMAKITGASIHTLSVLERGRTKRPNARHIQRLASGYGMTVRDFIVSLDFTRAQYRAAEREATDGHVTSNPQHPIHATRG